MATKEDTTRRHKLRGNLIRRWREIDQDILLAKEVAPELLPVLRKAKVGIVRAVGSISID